MRVRKYTGIPYMRLLSSVLVLFVACGITPEQADQVHKDVSIFTKNSDSIREEIHGYKESTDKLRGEVDSIRKDLNTKITGVHRNVAMSRVEITKAINTATSDSLLDQAGEFGEAFNSHKTTITKLVGDLSQLIVQQGDKIHGNEVLFDKLDDFRTKAQGRDREKIVDVVLEVKKSVDEGFATNTQMHKGANARLDKLESYQRSQIETATALEMEQKTLDAKAEKLSVDKTDSSDVDQAISDAVVSFVKTTGIFGVLIVVFFLRGKLPGLSHILPTSWKPGPSQNEMVDRLRADFEVLKNGDK